MDTTTIMKKVKGILKLWGEVFSKAGQKFIEENSFLYSAGIAFYTIFSLPGIALITVFIASTVIYEDNEVKTELLRQVSLMVNQSSADQVEALLERDIFTDEPVWVKSIGIIVLLVSTTTVFISLQNSLNSIWRIKPKPNKMILTFLLNRLVSLAMVVSIGFVLMVSLTLDTLIAVLRNVIQSFLGDFSFYIVMIVNYTFSIAITIIIFAAIYKVLPDAKIRWKDVWVGAIATTIFFLIGKFLIALYLDNSDLGDAYGAAGSLVALLSWVYYSVLILIFGAHFTFTYINVRGRKIKPQKGAVKVDLVEIEK
jgi:membrane protein